MSRALADHLRFTIEWERPDGVQSPELAATWARLEVWVDGDCITRVEDVETGSARRSVYLALYPLAEWIAYNWWLLRVNVRPAVLPSAAFRHPASPASRSWLRAHNVCSAGDGYVWPNLTILPEGPATRLVWHSDVIPRPGAPIRYLAAGEAWVDSFEAERALADLVAAVLTRLDEDGIHDVPLRDEWTNVTATTSEEAQFCLAAARLGLDPYTIDEFVEQAILRSGEALETHLLREFLDVVDPRAIKDGLAWIAASSAAIDDDPAKPSDQLKRLLSHPILDGAAARFELPWLRGWGQAQAVREALGLARAARFETSGLLEVKNWAGTDSNLLALGGLTPRGAGALVLGRDLGPRNRRFAEARALWHLLLPPARKHFLLSSSAAYGPRVERAFGAELLAPARGVDEMLGAHDQSVVSIEDVERVAEHFAVNPFVVRHQVENQLGLVVFA